MNYYDKLYDLLHQLKFEPTALMLGVEEVLREWKLSGNSADDCPLKLSDLDNRLVPGPFMDDIRDPHIPTGIRLLNGVTGGLRRSALHQIMGENYTLNNDLLLSMALDLEDRHLIAYFSFLEDKDALGKRVRYRMERGEDPKLFGSYADQEFLPPPNEGGMRFHVRNCYTTESLIHRIELEQRRNEMVLFFLESPEVMFTHAPVRLRTFLVNDMYAELQKCAQSRDIVIVVSSFNFGEYTYARPDLRTYTAFRDFQFNPMCSDSMLMISHTGRYSTAGELIKAHIWHSGSSEGPYTPGYFLFHQSGDSRVIDMQRDQLHLLEPDEINEMNRNLYPFVFPKQEHTFSF